MSSTQAKILVIDDDRESLSVLKALLTESLPACAVLTASSGVAGLALAEGEDPDAILLDILMPEKDGFEVCRCLKAKQQTRDIPVVFLSGLGADGDSRVQALDLGAEAFLDKPWSNRELVAQLRAMIKLKAAKRELRLEREHLEDLVAARTSALEKELAERKRAEEALRRSNETWGNTFNAITDVIFVISPEYEMLEINAAGCLALGRAKEQILGKKCFELMHCHDSPILGCPCRQSIADGKPCMGEYEKDGRSFSLVAWPTIDESGRVVSLAHITKDVTEDKIAEAEREQLEEQLRASQRMEAIGSLAGGIAHDFNNMLYVIQTFTELALDKLGDDDPLHYDLTEVKKASTRATTLVRQLLAFSRKQILQPVQLDLNRIISELEKMLHRVLGEDIVLVPLLMHDLGLTLADPSQIEQVIMNLVVNARDAMPTGGKLAIETRNLELGAPISSSSAMVKPGRYVVLTVTDTGHGMDAKTCERIFEPFFTTKGRGKGTGLGLSMVYGIVRQSGGEILVASEPGHGTTFKIYLPRSESAVEEAPKNAPVAIRMTGDETILIVEDESAVRDLARQVLVRAGYTVLTASNGSEALLLAERRAGGIHLVLTDVVMPEMGGRVFAEQLASSRPDTKILYMSGYTDDAILHHGTVGLGTHFLAKPFTLTDLRRKVRQVLDEN